MSIRERIILEEDRVVIHREQDVAGILDHAKARHNEGHTGFGDFKHAMVLPELVVENYCTKHQITSREFWANPAHLKRVMNDPDNAALRTWKGKV